MIQHGIRHDTDAQINEGMKRLILLANSHDIHSPVRKAAEKWLGCVVDEIKRRYPQETGDGWGGVHRDYGDEA
jgi:hypothetical protein